MNQTILPLVTAKRKGKLSSLIWVWQPVWEQENSEFKPVIDLGWDGLRQAIPDQDMLHELLPTTKIGYGTSE